MCAVAMEGELPWDGGEAPVILSDRLRELVRGEACGMFSALGCSVPMLVTPVSEALPALDRA